MARTLLLVDGDNLLWRLALGLLRAYPETTPFSVAASFQQTVAEQTRRRKARCVVLCFDGKRATAVRQKIAPYYKTNRRKHDDAGRAVVVAAAKRVRVFAAAQGWNVARSPDYEADDVIATLTDRWYAAHGAKARVRIVSSDHDLYALLEDERCVVIDPGTMRPVGGRDVKAIYGVWPKQWLDYRTLVGDTSDNVKGCPGIGRVNAAYLLKRFGNLDRVLKGGPSCGPPKRRQALVEFRKDAPAMREVLRLRDKAPLGAAPFALRPVLD